MTDFDSSLTDREASSDASRELTGVGPDVAERVAQVRHELQQQPTHGPDGCLIPGAVAAGDLLDRSQQLVERVTPMREQIADAILADRGLSRTEATQAQLMTARDIALLELIAENLIAAEMESAKSRNRTPFTTAKGRTATIVARLLSVLDRKAKLIQLLGIEREAKRVDLARAFAEQERNR